MNKIKLLMTAILFGTVATAHAQPGITAITFTGDSMAGGQGWPVVPAPGYWHIRAILVDSAHQPIGVMSPEVTLNTASASSFPTGFQVTLGQAAPAGASVLVYRKTAPIVDRGTTEQAEYDGLCTAGCVAGGLIVPVTGELLNSDFHDDHTALPVRLKDYSVD